MTEESDTGHMKAILVLTLEIRKVLQKVQGLS